MNVVEYFRRAQHVVHRLFQHAGSLLVTSWAVGLLLILLSVTWHDRQWPLDHFVSPALSHIAVALIVGALMVSVDKAIFYDDLKSELTAAQATATEHLVRLLNLGAAVRESGAQVLAAEAGNKHDAYGDLIRGSKTLTVVVNYGDNWISDWHTELVNFLKTGGALNWVMLDPDGAFLPVLADKYSLYQPTQCQELIQSVSRVESTLARLHTQAGRVGTVRIYRLAKPLFPAVSVYLGEAAGRLGQVVVTLYTTSSHKGLVPLMVFNEVPGRRSMYTFFKEDVERLLSAGSTFTVLQAEHAPGAA